MDASTWWSWVEALCSRWRPYLILFIFGAILRGIPEILVAKYPVGFDTNAYYPAHIAFLEKMDPVEVFKTAPLFYTIMWVAGEVTGVDVYLLLKIAGPVLYGFLGASFFFFLSSGVGLDQKASLLGCFTCMVQIVTLRLSWDLFRNELGLILFFLAVGVLWKNIKYRRVLFAFLGIAVVLAHPVAATMFFAVVGWLSLEEISSGKIKRFLVPAVPAGILFTIIVLVTFWLPSQPDPRIVSIGPEKPPLLMSYLESDPRFVEGTYLTILLFIGGLFLFAYGHLLPFVLRGVARNRVIDPLTGLLGFCSFSILAAPWFAVPITYWRWIILLIFPFTFYVVRGFEKWGLTGKHWRVLVLICLALSTVAVTYVSGTLPMRATLSYVKESGSTGGESMWSLAQSVNTYIPETLVQSSIGIGNVTGQIDDAVACLRWLNSDAGSNSVLLVEERFTSLALIHARRDIKIVLYGVYCPIRDVLKALTPHRFSEVYLVWYSHAKLAGFSHVHTEGAIAIHRYSG